MYRRVTANRVMIGFGFLGDILQPMVMYFVWNAAYEQSSQFAGMGRAQMITYLFIAHFFQVFTMGELEGTYAHRIRSGDLVRDLAYPQSFLWKQLFSGIGSMSAWGSLIGIPLLLVGVALFGVKLPPLPVLPALLISLTLAIVVNFGLSFVTGTLAFWTDGAIWGIGMAKRLLSAFASGALVPLALFPGTLRTVALALPFQAGVHIPTAIYLGQLEGALLWQSLGVQVFWAVALLIISNWFFHYSAQRMTPQGG